VIELRVALPGDAAGIAAIYAPLVAGTSISFEVEVPDAAEMARRILADAGRWPWLVADDGGIAGYAYAGAHRARAAYRWSVDVSVYVAERARRGGIGRRLYGALLGLLIEQGYYNAFAGVTLPNAPSVALHRAIGFDLVGVYFNAGYKFGAWHDVLWLQRELRPPSANVAEPLPLALLHDRVTAILKQ
jgi:phosphinothricin acetyltransferase